MRFLKKIRFRYEKPKSLLQVLSLNETSITLLAFFNFIILFKYLIYSSIAKKL